MNFWADFGDQTFSLKQKWEKHWVNRGSGVDEKSLSRRTFYVGIINSRPLTDSSHSQLECTDDEGRRGSTIWDRKKKMKFPNRERRIRRFEHCCCCRTWRDVITNTWFIHHAHSFVALWTARIPNCKKIICYCIFSLLQTRVREQGDTNTMKWYKAYIYIWWNGMQTRKWINWERASARKC